MVVCGVEWDEETGSGVVVGDPSRGQPVCCTSKDRTPGLYAYQRGKVYWNPPIRLVMDYERAEFSAALDACVTKGPGCWIAKGPPRADGYGPVIQTPSMHRYKIATVHRLAWAVRSTYFVPWLCVCHKCDRKTCGNPDHVFAGTDGDNVRDCYAKKRAGIHPAYMHVPEYMTP